MVNAKWGVFSTVEIVKSMVDSCIYHFEYDGASDTCDALLKTEIYDDSRFPEMYEGRNYTTTY